MQNYTEPCSCGRSALRDSSSAASEVPEGKEIGLLCSPRAPIQVLKNLQKAESNIYTFVKERKGLESDSDEQDCEPKKIPKLGTRRARPTGDSLGSELVHDLTIAGKRQRRASWPIIQQMEKSDETSSDDSLQQDWLDEVEIGGMQQHLAARDSQFERLLASIGRILPPEKQKLIADRAMASWLEIEGQMGLSLFHDNNNLEGSEALRQAGVNESNNQSRGQLDSLAQNFATPSNLVSFMEETRQELATRPQQQ